MKRIKWEIPTDILMDRITRSHSNINVQGIADILRDTIVVIIRQDREIENLHARIDDLENRK